MAVLVQVSTLGDPAPLLSVNLNPSVSPHDGQAKRLPAVKPTSMSTCLASASKRMLVISHGGVRPRAAVNSVVPMVMARASSAD